MIYTTTPGFFDLTTRPKGMTVKQHQKILETQMLLIGEAKKYRDPRVREANRFNYEKLREYMGRLQWTIIQYWGLESL